MRSPSAAYTFPESQSPSVVCPSVSHIDCRTSSPTISDKTSKQQGLVLNYRLERLQRLRRASRCWHGIASSGNGDYVDRSSRHAISTMSKKIVAHSKEDTDDGFIGFIEADHFHGTAAAGAVDSTKDKQESFNDSVEKTTSQFGIRRKNIRNITKRMIASRETSKRISVLQRMQGSRVTTVQGVLAVEGGIKLQSRHQAAVMKIQNVYRGRMERTKCAAGMGTARRDQNIVQRANAIRKGSTLKLIHQEAAIKLQACCRGYMQKMKYKRTVSGIVLCQNVAKRVFLKNTGSCRYLQRMDDQYRSTKNGTDFVINSSEWDSLGPIESTDHKNITDSFANAAFLALRLQAIYRGFRSRQQFVVVKSRLHELRRVEACIIIQSCWRSFRCCRDFAVTVMDITTVQSVVRRWFACRRVHKLKEVTLQQKHESEYEDPDETLGCSKCGLNTELEATITTVGEDLSFCLQDVSLEEEMNEIQLSFEEEILELQMSFEDEIARIQRRIHQVARMDFW